MTEGRGSVLVTGATGFLGAQVATNFARAGWRVFAGRRAGADPWRLAGVDGPILIDLDLETPETVRPALERARPVAVVHCAAYGVDYAEQDALRAEAVNVAGTLRLVEAAKDAGVGRFVHVGTAYEFGPAPSPVSETAPFRPQALYGVTKAEGARRATLRARDLGLAFAVVRPFTMYGPNERSSKLVPSLIGACLGGRRMKLTPGEQRRDYVFVGDVADAIRRLLALERFPGDEAFNIGAGRPISLRDLAETIRRCLGGGEIFGWGELPYRKDEIMELWADATKLESLIGRVARTPLEDGIRLTAAAIDRGAKMRA